MTQKQHTMHGRDHTPTGADPIPGLSFPGDTLEELILAGPALAGFWKLDETTGDIAHDSSGGGWDMTSGASSAAPTWGQAAGPPGTTSAQFGAGLGESNTSFGALSGDLTLEVWANRDNTLHNQFLIGQGNALGSNQPGVLLYLENATTGGVKRLTLIVGRNSGTRHLIESDTALETGAWHHCAVTRTSHVWKLYLDGAAQTGSYDDAGTSYDAATGIWLGQPPLDLTSICEGRLSYAAAYSRALSAAEIGARYTAATSSGDVVHMSDGSGGTKWDLVRDVNVAGDAALAPAKIAHPGGTTSFLRADGTWAAPASGSVAADTIWDAKGDLAAASGPDAAARLPVGSNGQVLTADSAQTLGMNWATPSAGGGGAVTLLSTTTLSSNGTFDVSSISGSYNDLLLVLIARGTVVGTSDNVFWRFNNDSAANYYWQLGRDFNATNVAAEGIAQNQFWGGTATGSTGVASAFGITELVLPGYASTVWKKAALWHSFATFTNATNNLSIHRGGGLWNSTAAITRVQVFGQVTANFATGSQLRIYGRT